MPATIDDPAILEEIGEALKGHGVGDNSPRHGKLAPAIFVEEEEN